MKKLNFYGWFAIAASVAFLASGCKVDKSYDLGNIDTEVTVLPGVEVPLPNFKEVKLKDLLPVNGVFGQNLSGDYQICYDVPTVKLDSVVIDADIFKLNMPTNGSSITGLFSVTEIPVNTPLSIPEGLSDSQKAAIAAALGHSIDAFDAYKSQVLTYNRDLDFSINDFPSQIKTFKHSALSGNLTFGFVPNDAFPFSQFQITEGSTISFPSFLEFAAYDDGNFVLEDNKHVLRAKKNVDVTVGTGNGLSIILPLAALNKGDGVSPTLDGSTYKLDLKEKIIISGGIYLNPEWIKGEYKTIGNIAGFSVTYINQDISLGACEISISCGAENVDLSSVTVQLSESLLSSIPDQSFNVDGIPAEFTGADVKIGLSDLQFNLKVDNKLPFDVSLKNGIIRAVDNNNAPLHSYNLPDLVFAQGNSTGYSIGEHAEGGADSQGNIYKNVAGIGSILDPVPSAIQASGFNAEIPSGDVTLNPGVYGAKLDVGIYAPLAFTSDSKLAFVITMDNVDLGIDDLPLEKAVVSFIATNTIPLNFTLEVTAKDESGAAISGISAAVSDIIKAGDLSFPKDNALDIVLTIAKGSPAIKSLDLALKASSDDTLAGAKLNAEEGIRIHDVYVTLPDGVTADMMDLLNSEE